MPDAQSDLLIFISAFASGDDVTCATGSLAAMSSNDDRNRVLEQDRISSRD